MAIESVGYFLVCTRFIMSIDDDDDSSILLTSFSVQVVLVIEYVLSSPGLLTRLGVITNCEDEEEEKLDSDVENEKKRIMANLEGRLPSAASSINDTNPKESSVRGVANVDASSSLPNSSRQWGVCGI